MFTFTARKLAPRTEYSLVRYNGSPQNIGLLAWRKMDLSGKPRLDGTWEKMDKRDMALLKQQYFKTQGTDGIFSLVTGTVLVRKKMLGIVYACDGKHR